MIKANHERIVRIFFLFFFFIQQTESAYRVHEATGKNVIGIQLRNSSYVVATSNSISLFSDNFLLIDSLKGITTDSTYNNIEELSNDNLVYVTKSNIYIIDISEGFKIIKTIDKTIETSSPRILIMPIQDYFFIGYSDSSTTTIVKYENDGTSTSWSKTITNVNSDLIDCLGYSNFFACTKLGSSNKDEIVFYNSASDDLETTISLNDKGIGTNSVSTYGYKLSKIRTQQNSNLILICIGKGQDSRPVINCWIGQITTGSSISITNQYTYTAGWGENTAALDWCQRNSRRFDALLSDTSTLGVMCGSKTGGFYQVSVATLQSGSISYSLKRTKLQDTGYTTDSYSFMFKYQDKYGAVYNENDGAARIQIIDSTAPVCSDLEEKEAFINSEFTVTVYRGSGGSTGTIYTGFGSIKDYFGDNTIKIKYSGSQIEEKKGYDTTDYIITVGSQAGKYLFAYTASSTTTFDKNTIGLYCRLVVVVKPCAEGCFTCTTLGTLSDTECNSCDTQNNYYPLSTKASQCYYIDKTDKTKNVVPDGMYYDSQDNTIKDCYLGCYDCSTGGTSTDDTQCTKCDEDNEYYPVKDATSQCYLHDSSKPVKHLYLSSSKVFEPCYTGCLTCYGAIDVGTHNCIECDTDNNFYPIEKDAAPYSCFKTDPTVQVPTSPDRYFFDKDTKTFISCDQACLTCTEKGTGINDDTRCTSCDEANGYFKYETEEAKCHSENEEITGYYKSGNMYKKCAEQCLNCVGSTNEDCLSCSTGSYPLVDRQAKCVKETDGEKGYKLNLSTKMFEKCDVGYIYCDSQKVQCDEDNGYYKLSNKAVCKLGKNEVEGYYLDTVNKEFRPCDQACKFCYGPKDQTTTNCKTCYSNKSTRTYYYPIGPITNDGTPKNCFNKLPGYFLFGNYFTKCDVSCETCEKSSKNCLSCAYSDSGEKYYPLAIKESSCFSESEKGKGSLPNDAQLLPGAGNKSSKWYTCDIACRECNGIGTEDETKCKDKMCNTSKKYYAISTYPSLCVTEEYIKANINKPASSQNPHLAGLYFYLNKKSKTFQRCSEECLECESTKSKCLNCNTQGGYYRLDEAALPGSCYSTDTKPKNYYLDTSPQNQEDYTYKKCYEKCETCDGPADADVVNGDHHCLTCNKNYLSNPEFTSRCEEKCPFYYYVDAQKKYRCTTTKECPSDFQYLYPEEKRCKNFCNTIIFENRCLTSCPSNTVPDPNDSKGCVIIEKCEKTLYTGYPTDLSEIETKIDGLTETYNDDFKYTKKHVTIIRHVEKQYEITIFKDSQCQTEMSEDLTSLNINDCPEKLRNQYGIDKSIPLTTLKMSITRPGKTNQLSYAFYNSKTSERLDMKYCEGEKIEMTVDISTTEGINTTQAEKLYEELGVDVYDSEDPFFNDICIPFTSEDGKDVTLESRRKAYYQNVSFCQDGCTYNGVNMETQEANCTCEIKTNFVTDILDNPLTGDFMEMLGDANFEVVKCFKGVFNFSNIVKNIGGWIICVIGLFELPFTIIYIKYGLMDIRILLLKHAGENPPRKQETENILDDINPVNDEKIPTEEEIHTNQIQKSSEICLKEEEISSQLHTSGYKQEKKSSKKIFILDQEDGLEDGTLSKLQGKKIPSERKISLADRKTTIGFDTPKTKVLRKKSLYSRKENETGLTRMSTGKIIFEHEDFHSNNETDSHDEEKPKKGKQPLKMFDAEKITEKYEKSSNGIVKKVTIVPKAIELEEEDDDFSDGELNELDLYDAIKYDHRKFCIFYWGQIKEKQTIINTFFVRDEYDCFPVKVICFLFGVAMYFTFNAVFYTESYISEQFESKEPVNFVYFMKNEFTRCIYSSIVGIAVDCVVGYISHAKKRIMTLMRRERDPGRFREQSIKIMKDYKKKINVFLIVNAVIMVIAWYYISAFCYCYKNSQTMWLIGSLLTWFFALAFPFISSFIVAGFRFLGIKCKSELCYKMSSCLAD